MELNPIFSDDRDECLAHYGVPGMKWGVRNAETQRKYAGSGASFRTKRMAKKDAKEFAQAKMYYGEGAGNRRKLIKNQVEQRKKDRRGYSEEFEKRLANTNWDKTVSKAKGQRKRKNIKNATTKTARGTVHALAGNTMYASAAAIALVSAAKITGLDKVVVAKGKQAVSSVVRNANNARIYANMARKAAKR